MVEEEVVWGGRNQKFVNPDSKVWLERMAAKGWTAPTWPKEYGGGGLSKAEAIVLDQELKRINARAPLASFGVWMLGPVLLEYANEEQKKRFLPEIVAGKMRWCQGYSEPGAGSDLASLQTKCEDKGDHWLINGSKIWTSLRQLGRLVLLPGAHGLHEEARRHLVRAVRHDEPGRRDAADPADLRLVALLRDVLHRREGAEGADGRRAGQGLGDRQAPAAV